MPDLTNITDFDPATGLTTTTLVDAHDRGAQDWATAEGQSHDTWHQISSGSTGGSLSGNFYWNPGTYAYGQVIRMQGMPWTPSLPTFAAVGTISLNGQDIGRYAFSGQVLESGDGFFAVLLAAAYLRPVNLDGVDNSALFASLNEQEVTLVWADVEPPVPISVPHLTTIDPFTIDYAAASTLLTVHGTGFISDDHEYPFATRIFLRGYELPTTFVSDTELNATVTPENLSITSARIETHVETGESVSNGFFIDVILPPKPTIASATPTTFSIAAGPVPVSVIGAGFVDGAIIEGGAGVAMETTFVSATELSGQFDPTSIVVGGTGLYVLNPDGQKSTAFPIQITA